MSLLLLLAGTSNREVAEATPTVVPGKLYTRFVAIGQYTLAIVETGAYRTRIAEINGYTTRIESLQ